MGEENYYQTPFLKALLSGLFAGISGTLLGLAFALIYRYSTGFFLFDYVNFPATIFGSNILLLACGIIYFYFRRSSKYGTAIYIMLFILLTAFLLIKIQGVQRSNVHQLTVEFRALLSGMVTILGICIFFLIPFLFGNKAFEKYLV